MNCPLCNRAVERVTLKSGTRAAIFVRCPHCTPEEPDYGSFFADRWGSGSVTVEEATPGESLAALLKRIPPDPTSQATATKLLALFAARCWFTMMGPGEVDDRTAAQRELADWLNAHLGKLAGEGVPL